LFFSYAVRGSIEHRRVLASGSPFVFRGVKNRSFSRSVHGRIHSGPENKCDLRPFPIDGRLVVLPPDSDDGSSRNGK
jgi:hypothetical protein